MAMKNKIYAFLFLSRSYQIHFVETCRARFFLFILIFPVIIAPGKIVLQTMPRPAALAPFFPSGSHS